jgi:hypothetical protein
MRVLQSMEIAQNKYGSARYVAITTGPSGMQRELITHNFLMTTIQNTRLSKME